MTGVPSGCVLFAMSWTRQGSKPRTHRKLTKPSSQSHVRVSANERPMCVKRWGSAFFLLHPHSPRLLLPADTSNSDWLTLPSVLYIINSLSCFGG